MGLLKLNDKKLQDMLKTADDKDLHIHEFTGPYTRDNSDIFDSFANYTGNNFYKSLAFKCSGYITHYVMHGENVVFITALQNIPQLINGFEPKVHA